jgi:4-hydroxybenzoate polyprenyltransferase
LMLLIVYLSAYIAYAYNRYQEIEKDSLDNIDRTAHLKKYQGKIPFLMIGSAGIMFLILALNTSLMAFLYILLVSVFGFVYTRWAKPITKKIPLFKNISVGIAFVLGAGFIFYYNSLLLYPLWKEALIIASFIFARVLCMQIFLDLKDYRADSAEGLKTLAVMKGKDFTLKFLKWAFPISMLPLILGIAYGFLPLISAALLLTLLFDYWAVSLAGRASQKGYLMQGSFAVFWPGILILGEILLQWISR